MNYLYKTALLIGICWGLPAAHSLALEIAAPPAVLASGVYQAGILADGRLLCVDYDGAMRTLDLATGAQAPWVLDWDAAADGWDTTGGAGFSRKLRVSPDGQHVAVAVGVGVTHPDPDGDYMDTAIAIVLSGPAGANARCVALAEVTDGGPQLDFTQDSSRLIGPWFFHCQPSAKAFQTYIASGYEAMPALAFNYIDTRTGKGGMQAGLPDYEFYMKAPDSDFFVSEALDEPGLTFATLTAPGITGSYIPDAAGVWSEYQWVLPDALLLGFADGSQRLVYVDGTHAPAPDPVWRCYATLPDGTCLFSDDRGNTVKYGKVDWPTFSIDWWIERPDLARFAEPLSAEGWPERVNTWIPLRDSSGVVIIEPGTGDVVCPRVSREGAKP